MIKIITKYNPPPIPRRDFDWCAYVDGQEENGKYGWGYTKAEAISDLFEICDITCTTCDEPATQLVFDDIAACDECALEHRSVHQ